jgi:hypothetical protein
VVVHDYATAPLIFEVRGLPAKPGDNAMDKYRGVAIGNIVDCEGGYVVTSEYFTAKALDRDGKVVKEFRGTDRHMANFIDVVRSRRTADLYGPLEEGHVSSSLCHLGNISHQLGRAPFRAGEIRAKVAGDAALAEACGRMMEHLEINHVDLAETPATLGLPLTIDPKAERFTGPDAAAANALLTRQYRKSFEVPQVA